MKKIRVLTVDDSAFIRVSLKKLIETDDIEICGSARNGEDAIKKIKQLNPDVVTLDVDMPVMNGIECLQEIKKQSLKVPVVMLSSLTTKGAQVTLDALYLGAIDFIQKPSAKNANDLQYIAEEIREKIRIAAKVDLKKHTFNRTKIELDNKRKIAFSKMQKESVETEIKKKKKINYEICLIGTSTGGPPALQKVLRDLPENFPLGIVIVQHMPKTFTASLAERLNSICNIRVKESEDRDCIEPGLAIIGKAGYQIDFYRQNGKVYIRNVEPEETDLFKPSVNKMFMNASKVYNKILGAVMTGMGNDGLESIQQLKNSNMYIIAESKETAVVYGMPGVLAKAGLADKILPLWKISDELIKQA